MKKKVSIIIPIFNAEKTLVRCLDSVLKIKFSDMEIILIDDGSADNSLGICKEYQKKDKRVQVYSQKNAGVSVARNMGISIACGEWIGFIDSDDEIIPETYEEAINSLEENTDYLIWKSVQVYSENEKNEVKNEKISRIVLKNEDIEIIRTGIIEQENPEFQIYWKLLYNFYGPCAKFFKKDIIVKNNIKFMDNLKIGEDRLFNYQYLKYVKEIVCLNQYGYIYYHNVNSATHIFQENRYLEFYKLYSIFSEYAPEKRFELAQLGIRMYLYMLKNDFCHINNPKNYMERRKKALKVRRDMEKCFREGDIYKLRKEAIVLAFFAKYENFALCNFLLKVKEIFKIRVR